MGKSHAAEVNDSIFVFDAGSEASRKWATWGGCRYPQHGIIYLKTRTALRVFSTHGHADAIGTPVLPFGGSESPCIRTVDHWAGQTLSKAMTVWRNSTTSMSSIRILRLIFGDACRLFQTTCSIPESIGIVDWHPEGNIVYTGDFKSDQTASESYATDFARLAEIGREGVLALWVIQPRG